MRKKSSSYGSAYVCAALAVSEYYAGAERIWSGAQQYAEILLKSDKNLKKDWLTGDESWKETKDTYHIRLTYYANKEDAEQGQESTYEYVIRFDETEGFIIRSEGVPEKELDMTVPEKGTAF